MRKIMFGTRSEQGERAVERLLTIVRTCQLQQLNSLAYLRGRHHCSSSFSTATITVETTSDPLNCYLEWVHRDSSSRVLGGSREACPPVDTLLKTSNCYYLPGRAVGSPN